MFVVYSRIQPTPVESPWLQFPTMQSIWFLSIFLISAAAQKVAYVENIVTCSVNITSEAKRAFGYLEDAYLNITQIIRKYGYPVEQHEVITQDGYILNIFRIPHGRKMKQKLGPPVVLMHGMTDSPTAYVLTGPGNGLGYQLADEGYDVWLVSFRGCRYTRRHVSLDPDRDVQYWKYSSEQMGAYDLPAILDRVLRETGRSSVGYVGHSLGCRMFFEMGAYAPQMYDRINSMTCLGPAVWLKNIFHPVVRLLVKIIPYLEALGNTLGFQELFGHTSVITQLLQVLCAGEQYFSGHWRQKICSAALFLVVGDDYGQLREGFIPVVFGHIPNGASLQMYLHLSQGIAGKEFRRFDHGLDGNMRAYGAPEPPHYDLSSVSTPVSVVVGVNDWLSSVRDAELLMSRLPNAIELHVIPRARWQHSDYMWAREAPRLVGDRIIAMLRKYAR